MKRANRELLVLMLVTNVGGLIAGAQQSPAPPAAAAPTNAPGPKIQFATPLYDFGRARAGDPVKYTYVFTNTGDAKLVINSVQPQCGCTTAGDWTKQVEPGKTGVIPIQFNTSAYNGPVFKQVTVNCNVTNQPLLFLQLKGTVYKPFEVIPQMAVFNVTAESQATPMILTITNHMEEPLFLSPPTVNNHIFSAELITNTPGKGYQVKITTVPPLPGSGSAMGHMTLPTSWTNTPTISVTLVANIQPPVIVTPAVINLPPGPLPNPMTNSVLIHSLQGTNLLSLSEPKVNAEGVEVQIRQNQPGRSYTALLEFPRGFEVPANQPVEFVVKTGHPKLPEVKVPVRQMPRPAPRAQSVPTVAPAPSFPLVPPGAPAGPAGKESSAAAPAPPPRPPLPAGP